MSASRNTRSRSRSRSASRSPGKRRRISSKINLKKDFEKIKPGTTDVANHDTVIQFFFSELELANLSDGARWTSRISELAKDAWSKLHNSSAITWMGMMEGIENPFSFSKSEMIDMLISAKVFPLSAADLRSKAFAWLAARGEDVSFPKSPRSVPRDPVSFISSVTDNDADDISPTQIFDASSNTLENDLAAVPPGGEMTAVLKSILSISRSAVDHNKAMWQMMSSLKASNSTPDPPTPSVIQNSENVLDARSAVSKHLDKISRQVKDHSPFNFYQLTHRRIEQIKSNPRHDRFLTIAGGLSVRLEDQNSSSDNFTDFGNSSSKHLENWHELSFAFVHYLAMLSGHHPDLVQDRCDFYTWLSSANMYSIRSRVSYFSEFTYEHFASPSWSNSSKANVRLIAQTLEMSSVLGGSSTEKKKSGVPSSGTPSGGRSPKKNYQNNSNHSSGKRLCNSSHDLKWVCKPGRDGKCGYLHKCKSCGGNHALSKCAKKKNASGSASGLPPYVYLFL